MRGGLLTFLFGVAFSACPPPIDESCQRVLIDVNGNPNMGGFGGGPGSEATPPLGLVNAPLTLTIFAPLSTCVSDTLRADVTLTDPNNLPAAITQQEPAARSGISSVKTVVTFTPLTVGLHTLKVAFEPSLGVRSLLIDVAEDGLQHRTTRVPIPTGENCYSNATWPLSDDTVACEERGPGYVSVTSADGGVTRFRGTQLVVVDRVLWSIDPTNATLDRRVFEDGGLAFTHSFSNFPPTATPAMHDLELAMRFRTNGRLTRVRLTPDGGSDLVELSLDGLLGPPLAYFAEDNDVVFRWSQVDCSFNNCVNFTDLVAVEPGFVWRAVNAGFEPSPSQARVSGFTRPTTQSDSTPAVTLPYAVESANTPAFAFERMPLWLNVAGPRRVLASKVDGGVSFTAWPRGEVLRVGRNHVVLVDADPGFVRVVVK